MTVRDINDAARAAIKAVRAYCDGNGWRIIEQIDRDGVEIEKSELVTGSRADVERRMKYARAHHAIDELWPDLTGEELSELDREILMQAAKTPAMIGKILLQVARYLAVDIDTSARMAG